MYVSKLPLTIFSDKSTWAMISLWPDPILPKYRTDRELAYQSFVSVYWTYLSRGGGVIKGPIRKGDNEKETVCMETEYSPKDQGITVACLTFRGTWTATLYGDPSEAQSLFNIIESSK